MALHALCRRQNFQRVYRDGKLVGSNGLTIHFAPNTLPVSRFGVAAKKAVGGAVARNRIRRWARELLRAWQTHLAEGYDIIVLVRSPQATLSFVEFATHLGSALRKAELIDNVPELHN